MVISETDQLNAPFAPRANLGTEFFQDPARIRPWVDPHRSPVRSGTQPDVSCMSSLRQKDIKVLLGKQPLQQVARAQRSVRPSCQQRDAKPRRISPLFFPE